MSNRTFVFLSLTIAAAIVALSTSLSAQRVVQDTAYSSVRSATPSPSRVTVITSEDIQRRNVTRLDELFQGMVPGFIALDRNEEEETQWYARGIAGVGVPTRIRVFLNGTELDDPAHINRINPEFVDRIEITTGLAAGVVQWATGGVVRIFTKRGGDVNGTSGHRTFVPVISTLMSAGAERSLYNRKASLNQRHALNLSGGTQRFGYYFGGGYTTNGNYAPESKSHGSNGLLGITTTSRWVSAHLFGATSQTTARVPQARHAIPPEPVPLPPVVSPTPRQTQLTDFKSNSFGGTVAITLTPWWRQELRAGSNYGGRTSAGLFVLPDFNSDTLLTESYGKQHNQRYSYQYMSAFALPQRFGINPTIQAGYEHVAVRTGLDTGALSYTLNSEGSSQSASTQSRQQTLSGYFASIGLEALNAFSFNAGFRRGRDHNIANSDRRWHWSPFAAAAYQFAPGPLSVTTRIGFGSLNTRNVDPSKLGLPFPGYQIPESAELRRDRIMGIEGGIDLAVQDGPRFGITVFHQKGRDGMVNVLHPSETIQVSPLPGGFDFAQYFSNVYTTLQTRGAELSSQWSYGPFDAQATFSVAKTTVAKIDSLLLPEWRQYQESEALSNTPRQIGALWLAYTWRNTSIGTEARYVGQHTERDVLQPATPEPQYAVYGASTIYNITITQALNARVSILGYAYNLMNIERYGSTNAEYARGRRIGIGVRTR